MSSHAPLGPARDAPDVRIVSGHGGLHGDAFGVHGSPHPRPAHRDPHGPIVMCLLAASTTLALYDLYVLICALIPARTPDAGEPHRSPALTRPTSSPQPSARVSLRERSGATVRPDLAVPEQARTG